MSHTAQFFGIGMLLGIIVFFVLAYFGWIDKLINKLNQMFK